MAALIENLFGMDMSDTAALAFTVIALLLVLALIWLLVRFVRQPRFAGKRGKQARLAITDAARIDDRRRLVLVRRDDVEHLIMIGGSTDLLVETDIRRLAPARARATPAQNGAPHPVGQQHTNSPSTGSQTTQSDHPSLPSTGKPISGTPNTAPKPAMETPLREPHSAAVAAGKTDEAERPPIPRDKPVDWPPVPPAPKPAAQNAERVPAAAVAPAVPKTAPDAAVTPSQPAQSVRPAPAAPKPADHPKPAAIAEAKTASTSATQDNPTPSSQNVDGNAKPRSARDEIEALLNVMKPDR